MIRMTAWGEKLEYAECFSGLSSRARNVLAVCEIRTPEQLAAISTRDLRHARNCGRKTINEYRAFLQERGLDLADPVESKIQALEREVRQLKARIKELGG